LSFWSLIFISRGTGASTIYALLACKLSNNWNFIGTGMHLYDVSPPNVSKKNSDIDALSLQFANENVRNNALEARIRIVHSIPDGPVLESLFEDETFRCGSLATT
jgi:23S rRNA (adenine1618-N6)-methyltransferase